MIGCTKCNSELRPGSKFCEHCGAQVQESSAAPTSAEYVLPVKTAPGTQQPQGYAAQPAYAPVIAPTAKKPINKKILIFGVAAVAAILIIVLLVSTLGGKDNKAAANDDLNLGVYTAVSADMLNMEVPESDFREDGFSIELMEKDQCSIEIDGNKGSGKWTLAEDGTFHVKGSGIDCTGTLAGGVMILENVLDMDVSLTLEKEGGYSVLETGGNTQQQGAAGAEPTAIQRQWNGTWYGCLSFADFESQEHDAYMVVDVNAEGIGTFTVYIAGSNVAFASAICEAEESGLYATRGEVISTEMNTDNWMFLPMPDYPDQYAMQDELADGDGYLDFALFMKIWGGSWQDEIDSDFAIIPPGVDSYMQAIENGEQPPYGSGTVGFTSGHIDSEQSAAPIQTDEKSAFAGAHEFTLKTFMGNIETMLKLTVPDNGWCTKLYSGKLWVYNVPTLDDAYSNSPRIQFETKKSVADFDFYIDDFENLKVIESRIIGGIKMAGRTYKNVGMEWFEYVGQLPNGVAISIQISRIDIGTGTEGSTILDSVLFE